MPRISNCRSLTGRITVKPRGLQAVVFGWQVSGAEFVGLRACDVCVVSNESCRLIDM